MGGGRRQVGFLPRRASTYKWGPTGDTLGAIKPKNEAANPTLHYLRFQLLISAGPKDGYSVHALTPRGEGRARFQLPFSLAEAAAAWRQKATRENLFQRAAQRDQKVPPILAVLNAPNPLPVQVLSESASSVRW